MRSLLDLLEGLCAVQKNFPVRHCQGLNPYACHGANAGTVPASSPSLPEEEEVEEDDAAGSCSKKKAKPVADATVAGWQSLYPWMEVVGVAASGHPLVCCTLCKKNKAANLFSGTGGATGATVKDASESHFTWLSSHRSNRISSSCRIWVAMHGKSAFQWQNLMDNFLHADGLKQHHDSAQHKKAVLAEDGRTEFRRAASAATAQSRRAISSFLEMAFSLTLLCVLEKLPISKWAVLLGYLAFLGHPEITRKYNQKRYFWAFLSTISELVLAAQMGRLKDAAYFSILLDSSTDVSNEEHCLIYIRCAR